MTQDQYSEARIDAYAEILLDMFHKHIEFAKTHNIYAIEINAQSIETILYERCGKLNYAEVMEAVSNAIDTLVGEGVINDRVDLTEWEDEGIGYAHLKDHCVNFNIKAVPDEIEYDKIYTIDLDDATPEEAREGMDKLKFDLKKAKFKYQTNKSVKLPEFYFTGDNGKETGNLIVEFSVFLQKQLYGVG